MAHGNSSSQFRGVSNRHLSRQAPNGFRPLQAVAAKESPSLPDAIAPSNVVFLSFETRICRAGSPGGIAAQRRGGAEDPAALSLHPSCSQHFKISRQ